MDNFFKSKRVLVTGHTGFKGSWLVSWLLQKGALVRGIALNTETNSPIYTLLNSSNMESSHYLDILDLNKLKELINEFAPEIVYHLAAQPIVIESYNDPIYTHKVNYVGTLNILESLRFSQSVKQIIVITTDKVYEPINNLVPHKETDRLGGNDPYSASKASVEILCKSYYESFFKVKGIQVSTVRAGNVIGFGDKGSNRLIPDIMSSIQKKKQLIIRNKYSIRPWQDVNDVVSGYLKLTVYLSQENSPGYSSWNFGPNQSQVTVLDIVDKFKHSFPELEVTYEGEQYPENPRLLLDTMKAKIILDWETTTNIDESISNIVKLTRLQQEEAIDQLNLAITSKIKNHPYY